MKEYTTKVIVCFVEMIIAIKGKWSLYRLKHGLATNVTLVWILELKRWGYMETRSQWDSWQHMSV